MGAGKRKREEKRTVLWKLAFVFLVFGQSVTPESLLSYRNFYRDQINTNTSFWLLSIFC